MGGTSGIIKRQIGKKGIPASSNSRSTTAGEDAYLTIPIIVRSIVETENADEFRYGFEFFEVPTVKLILSSFVHQTLAGDRINQTPSALSGASGEHHETDSSNSQISKEVRPWFLCTVPTGISLTACSKGDENASNYQDRDVWNRPTRCRHEQH